MRTDSENFEEEILGKPYDAGLIKKLLPLVKPYKIWFICSMFLVVLITLLNLSIPYITKIAIDRYIVPVQDNREIETGQASNTRMVTADFSDKTKVARLRKNDLMGVTRAAGLLFLVVCFNYILNFIQLLIMEYSGQMIMHDLRMKIFNHIQSLCISFFTRNPIGRLVTRTTNDVQNMHEMFTSVFTFIFKDIFLIIGITIVLTTIDWKLALVTFTVLPVVFGASYYFARVARDVYRTLRIKVAEINSRFSETIQGIRVIKLFGHEEQNYRRFEQLNHENYQAAMKQVHIFAVYMPLIELMSAVALALIIYYGGGRVLLQEISLGELVAFISYIKMFFRPIRDMAEKFNIMQNALSSAERIFLILDNREILPRLKNGSAADIAEAPVLEKIESLYFEQVSFSYVDKETVVNDISFGVEQGETVAIVGPTGAGKTSLINLIIRFYDPTSGMVSINGKDIRNLDEHTLRSKMALVMQDPFLFSDTIRENIAFGKTDMTDKELEHILQASNCRFFVDRLANGADTVLSEGGGSLSSGERQLISIARAFAKNPDLLILDEATSYIDTDTEQKIQEALSNLMTDRTAIIIAHRLSTVRKADRIIVLNKGKIIETGSYEALMEKKGFYYKLHQY